MHPRAFVTSLLPATPNLKQLIRNNASNQDGIQSKLHSGLITRLPPIGSTGANPSICGLGLQETMLALLELVEPTATARKLTNGRATSGATSDVLAGGRQVRNRYNRRKLSETLDRLKGQWSSSQANIRYPAICNMRAIYYIRGAATQTFLFALIPRSPSSRQRQPELPLRHPGGAD
eukprot:1148494-Prorocentrum_minimum.AAC.4